MENRITHLVRAQALAAADPETGQRPPRAHREPLPPTQPAPAGQGHRP
jgi:hypothetical protein